MEKKNQLCEEENKRKEGKNTYCIQILLKEIAIYFSNPQVSSRPKRNYIGNF